ncbi:MAG: DUF58 domain-containing protein [Bacillota bacterium]|nr:DUF58 domain-containing protein [Bacillota bacterium]
MKRKGKKEASLQHIHRDSSFLTHPAALAVFLCLTVLTFLWGQLTAAALLLFLLLLGVCSRTWGRRALKNVELELSAPPARIFAGQQVELLYRIKNQKLLPLVWMEVVQRLPENGCMAPADAGDVDQVYLPEDQIAELEETYRKAVEKAAQAGEKEPVPRPCLTSPAFHKKFAFILWYQELEWTSCWKAEKRGLYAVESVLVRSGDGFGLTRTEKDFCPRGRPVFAVYPQLVPVRSEPLLNNMWNAQARDKGYLEDATIIRSERAYQPYDSWKRIDWRMAARGKDLQVKLYEMILPRSVHFVLDAASFAGCGPEQRELEEMISILASLILCLEERQVSCGLSLPETESSPAVMLPEGTERDELLMALTAFDCRGRVRRMEAADLQQQREGAGQLYFCTYSPWETARGEFFEELQDLGVQLISYQEKKDDLKTELRVLPVALLRGGGNRG